VSWPGLDAVVESWKVQQWFPVSRLMVGSNRTLYAPVGDYGVNVLSVDTPVRPEFRQRAGN